METTIIAFGNKSGHGKDAAAKILLEHFSEEFDIRRYAFADELKYEVNEMFLDEERYNEYSSREEVWKALCRKLGVKYDPNAPMDDPKCPFGKQRYILQYLGQSNRTSDPFYWIRKVDARIKLEKPEFAILTDMRYQNCFQWVKSTGGYCVKVRRIGYHNPKIDNNHISEVDLDNTMFDYFITTPLDGLDILREVSIAVFRDIAEKVNATRNV